MEIRTSRSVGREAELKQESTNDFQPPIANLAPWRIAALVLTLAAVLFISIVPQVSNDFWLQAKVGELIAQSGSIPKTVLFPFTEVKDAPFNAHEWLPSLGFHGLIAIVGESGLPLVMGGMGLLFFAIMTRLAYERSGGNLPLPLLLGLLAVGVENQRHYLRPELLSLILLGLYWYLLEASRYRPHFLRWAGAFVLVVLWANTHGSFILAPIISGLYAMGIWIDRRRLGTADHAEAGAEVRPYLWFTVGALVATLMNPVGWDLWKFVLDFGRADSTKWMVTEWLPTFDPRWRDNRGFWIGTVCAGVTTLLMLWQWRRLRAVDVLLFLLFMTLATQAIRFLVYVGMVAAYVLPALVPASWNANRNRTRCYAALAVLAALTLGLSARYGNAFGAFPHSAFEANYSLSEPMVKQLGNPELQGNVLNSYELGAELVYRAYPRLRPSIDSRIDSYGADWTALNAQLFLDDDLLREFVRHYDVRYMLLSHNDFLSLQRLRSWTDKQWSLRAIDRRTVLLQRAQPTKHPG